MIPLHSLTNKKTNQEHLGSKCEVVYLFDILNYFISVIILILGFIASIPIQGFAQVELDVPELSIQTQSYLHNPDAGTYLYRNAKVEWEEISVESTEILYHPEKNKLTAKG